MWDEHVPPGPETFPNASPTWYISAASVDLGERSVRDDLAEVVDLLWRHQSVRVAAEHVFHELDPVHLMHLYRLVLPPLAARPRLTLLHPEDCGCELAPTTPQAVR